MFKNVQLGYFVGHHLVEVKENQNYRIMWEGTRSVSDAVYRNSVDYVRQNGLRFPNSTTIEGSVDDGDYVMEAMTLMPFYAGRYHQRMKEVERY
jgi:hypothetical protein